MRTTAVQRRNDRMHRIFEEGRKNNALYAPRHLFQVLTRMTEKVVRADSIQRSGGRVTAEEWSELYMLTNEAKQVLERAKEARLIGPCNVEDGI